MNFASGSFLLYYIIHPEILIKGKKLIGFCHFFELLFLTLLDGRFCDVDTVSTALSALQGANRAVVMIFIDVFGELSFD